MAQIEPVGGQLGQIRNPKIRKKSRRSEIRLGAHILGETSVSLAADRLKSFEQLNVFVSDCEW